MGRAYNTYGGENECIYDFVGRSRRKRTLGRLRSMCEDNTKMYLGEIRWGGMEWIDLDEDRDQWKSLVNAAMNFRVA
jgi:hypothetical protein